MCNVRTTIESNLNRFLLKFTFFRASWIGLFAGHVLWAFGLLQMKDLWKLIFDVNRFALSKMLTNLKRLTDIHPWNSFLGKEIFVGSTQFVQIQTKIMRRKNPSDRLIIYYYYLYALFSFYCSFVCSLSNGRKTWMHFDVDGFIF